MTKIYKFFNRRRFHSSVKYWIRKKFYQNVFQCCADRNGRIPPLNSRCMESSDLIDTDLNFTYKRYYNIQNNISTDRLTKKMWSLILLILTVRAKSPPKSQIWSLDRIKVLITHNTWIPLALIWKESIFWGMGSAYHSFWFWKNSAKLFSDNPNWILELLNVKTMKIIILIDWTNAT
jgi:hypothetical protein